MVFELPTHSPEAQRMAHEAKAREAEKHGESRQEFEVRELRKEYNNQDRFQNDSISFGHNPEIMDKAEKRRKS